MMQKSGGGAIVNMSSTSWKIGLGGMAAYTASKSGVTGLTRRSRAISAPTISASTASRPDGS